jgi:hypothetical protein
MKTITYADLIADYKSYKTVADRIKNEAIDDYDRFSILKSFKLFKDFEPTILFKEIDTYRPIKVLCDQRALPFLLKNNEFTLRTKEQIAMNGVWAVYKHIPFIFYNGIFERNRCKLMMYKDYGEDGASISLYFPE